MRQHQPHTQCEWLGLGRLPRSGVRLAPQPVAGSLCHIHVMHFVGGQAGARALQAGSERVVGAVEDTHVMRCRSDPVAAVVTHFALGITVELIGSDRMQPADQRGLVARRAQTMQIGRDVAGQHVGVGPAGLR